MSLDIYLTATEETKGECFHCGSSYLKRQELYSANITHNLTTMARKANLYAFLWRPKEVGVKTAKDLIEPLKDGLHLLRDKPEYYETFNAENGWGKYEHFVPFVEDLLKACIEHPTAEVEVSV